MLRAAGATTKAHLKSGSNYEYIVVKSPVCVFIGGGNINKWKGKIEKELEREGEKKIKKKRERRGVCEGQCCCCCCCLTT